MRTYFPVIHHLLVERSQSLCVITIKIDAAKLLVEVPDVECGLAPAFGIGF